MTDVRSGTPPDHCLAPSGPGRRTVTGDRQGTVHSLVQRGDRGVRQLGHPVGGVLHGHRSGAEIESELRHEPRDQVVGFRGESHRTGTLPTGPHAPGAHRVHGGLDPVGGLSQPLDVSRHRRTVCTEPLDLGIQHCVVGVDLVGQVEQVSGIETGQGCAGQRLQAEQGHHRVVAGQAGGMQQRRSGERGRVEVGLRVVAAAGALQPLHDRGTVEQLDAASTLAQAGGNGTGAPPMLVRRRQVVMTGRRTWHRSATSPILNRPAGTGA